jgi:hypothetical protein
MKVYTLNDITFYLYRSLLPVPLWGSYFSHGGTGSKIFTILYFAIKFIDLSWKLKGTIEGYESFFGNKLVS